MKHPKDPFEAAIEEEQEKSPPESPVDVGEAKNKDENDEQEEEEENMEVEVAKLYPSGAYPANMMQTIMSQFTEDQMSRYESFRRSGFTKSKMGDFIKKITGSHQKIDDDTNTVVRGIAKMFVGDLVETARVVMRERKESGPVRPCHIRESYRRLKLQGKLPKRSIPRLFH